MTALVSWLLVGAVMAVVVMVGCAIERDGQRFRQRVRDQADASASPGRTRRRAWLLEQLDRPDLTVEQRAQLNAELLFYGPSLDEFPEASFL